MVGSKAPFEIIDETADKFQHATRPSDIYTGLGSLLSTFGYAEVEQEATRLVQFF